MTKDELQELMQKLMEEQKATNALLVDIIEELRSIKKLLRQQATAAQSDVELDLFDPQVLLRFNKRLQEVIKEIARYFQKGHETLVVEDLQRLMGISYPQAAHYLKELEKEGLIASRRGDRSRGENPLKKYYYLPDITS